jgi:hypothetical protein
MTCCPRASITASRVFCTGLAFLPECKVQIAKRHTRAEISLAPVADKKGLLKAAWVNTHPLMSGCSGAFADRRPAASEPITRKTRHVLMDLISRWLRGEVARASAHMFGDEIKTLAPSSAG